jgi:hypothetical protein
MEEVLRKTGGLMRKPAFEMVDFFKYHSKVDQTREKCPLVKDDGRTPFN